MKEKTGKTLFGIGCAIGILLLITSHTILAVMVYLISIFILELSKNEPVVRREIYKKKKPSNDFEDYMLWKMINKK